MLTSPTDIRSIVFDLDGTLYASAGLANEIEAVAESLVAESRGVPVVEGRRLLRRSRRRLGEELGEEPTLTRTCLELGIEVAEFHCALQGRLRPERYLGPDPILYALLDSLRDDYHLYLYTNNSLPMAQKILALLGVEGLFERLYTIEFAWVPKPDPTVLQRVLEDIGGLPESFLFVGDRLPVDLRLPADLGIPTMQVRDAEDLLQIHKLLGLIP